MDAEAARWRLRADSYTLVAGVAAARGVNPRLVLLLEETATRYGQWAVEADRWDAAGLCPEVPRG